mgnify:CR=1 FL=1
MLLFTTRFNYLYMIYDMSIRLGRWELDAPPPMGSPTNAIIGLYMLWWGWLAFNAGSTFGVSGNKWRLSAKAAVTTMIASFRQA